MAGLRNTVFGEEIASVWGGLETVMQGPAPKIGVEIAFISVVANLAFKVSSFKASERLPEAPPLLRATRGRSISNNPTLFARSKLTVDEIASFCRAETVGGKRRALWRDN